MDGKVIAGATSEVVTEMDGPAGRSSVPATGFGPTVTSGVSAREVRGR
jgi:hypothetical protein